MSDAQETLLELSDRERQIVVLVALGYTNRQVAQRIGVTHDTVGSHLRRIYQRTGAASRFDLCVMAVMHGLVQFEQLATITALRAQANLLVNSLEW